MRRIHRELLTAHRAPRSRPRRGARVAAWLLPALLGFVPASAQLPAPLVEQALDQPIEQLDIPAAPLREALARLEKETGLRFVVTPAAIDLMPYGEQTLVVIEIRRMSVRASLERVLAGLGLQMTRDADKLVIAPRRGLERMNRALRPEELELIARLAREPWSTAAGGASVELQIDPARNPRALLDAALAQVPNRPALEQLDGATQALQWAWRLDGARVIFCTRKDEIRRRLDQPFDLSMQRRALDAALIELGQRAGVTILFEPGCLKRIDARDRAVDLVQRGVTARQVFERIAGNTGLAFEITDEGVRFSYPPAPTTQAPLTEAPASELATPRNGTDAPARAATIFAAPDIPPLPFAPGWVTIPIEVRPGLTIHALVPVQQLPVDLRAELERRLQSLNQDGPRTP